MSKERSDWFFITESNRFTWVRHIEFGIRIKWSGNIFCPSAPPGNRFKHYKYRYVPYIKFYKKHHKL